MTSRNWTVHAAGCRFSMGGEEMTKAEALAVVRSIWPDASIEAPKKTGPRRQSLGAESLKEQAL